MARQIGRTIRALREQANVSAADLGMALIADRDEMDSMSPTQVKRQAQDNLYRREKGETPVTVADLFRIEETLGCRPGTILIRAKILSPEDWEEWSVRDRLKADPLIHVDDLASMLAAYDAFVFKRAAAEPDSDGP